MKIFVTLTILLFIVGCVEKTSLIPSGIYISTESGSEERVEVKKSEIFLRIKNVNGDLYDRKLGHSVNPDGRITFIGISSNEWSILRYEWTFDGKVILKEDIKSKKKVSFVRKE